MAKRISRFSRIGRKEVWGIPLLILTGWIYAFLSFLLDVVLLNNWSPVWILIYLVTFGEVVFLAWIYRTRVLNRFEINSAWLNLGVAGVLAKRKDGTQVIYRVQSEKAVTLCRTVCTQIAIEMDEPSSIPLAQRLSPRMTP